MAKSIVLTITPVNSLTEKQLREAAKALEEAFNEGAFYQFFDYGKSNGAVKVEVKVSP